ncbi:MAG: Hsp20/alpha crystallin family protein [Acidimicrobiales bacterium]|nr:Hsp20/alpha crystallin family protein [Actinomycetota bacterium]
MALVRSDPFRELDRLAQQLWGDGRTRSSSLSMPMDAYRKGDVFLVQIDLPGVQSDSIELTVEDNVLTVRAERPSPEVNEGVEALVAERPYGTFSRQMFLGDNLDVDRIEAAYETGVLTVTIPVAAHAKPRRIEITTKREREAIPA